MIPNCTTYLIKERGHMNFMTDEEKEMIRRFMKGDTYAESST